MRNIFKYILLTGFTLTLSSCAKLQHEQHCGFSMDTDIEQHLKVGEVNAQDLVYYFGSPTIVSNFNGTHYYYVSYNQVKLPLSEPEIKDYKVLALDFDNRMVLSGYRFIDEHNMDEFEFSRGKIHVSGNKLNPFEQMVKNVGRFQDPNSKGN
jgi:outer membrane protein assembly factor BamE (lipoprotein component of BamABCDE complex)